MLTNASQAQMQMMMAACCECNMCFLRDVHLELPANS